MFDEVLAEAFASELEKVAFDPLAALAALGAIAGGAYGASDPARFNPGWIDKSLAGGTGLKGRGASGLLGAATIGGIMALPKLLSAPFAHEHDEEHTAAVKTRKRSYYGGANKTKGKLKGLFKSRPEARKAWRENMHEKRAAEEGGYGDAMRTGAGLGAAVGVPLGVGRGFTLPAHFRDLPSGGRLSRHATAGVGALGGALGGAARGALLAAFIQAVANAGDGQP